MQHESSDTHAGAAFTVRALEERDVPAARRLILRVLEEDLGYGYRPEWHGDLDDLAGTYIRTPRQRMCVAVEQGPTGEEVLGTIAVRPGGPSSPPHPRWLAEQYAGDDVAQVFRAYIAREQRRRGVATALVESIRAFVGADPSYRVIYLHTDPVAFPGALDFWRRMPVREIHDGRGSSESQAVHFELAFADGAFSRPAAR